MRDAKIPVCHDFFLSFCFFVCFAFYREILPLLWFIYSSHRRCSLRKDALRNFAKFTGKHLCQSLFLNKGAGRGLHWVSFLIKLQAESCNFIEKETLAQVFSCEFCEISKNTFFTEYLWATSSVYITVHFILKDYQKDWVFILILVLMTLLGFWKSWTIFAKPSISDVWQGPEYTSRQSSHWYHLR